MDHDSPLGPVLFDADATFDEDYAYFAEAELTEQRTAQEVETIWRILDLTEGAAILDLGCGPGRIATALARKGARVTGLDRSERLLAQAREIAADLHVDYRAGDMRDLPRDAWFDAVLLWNTSFGYFDERDNARVLAEAFKVLKPGGRLLVDQAHRAALLGRPLPATDLIRRGPDFALNILDFDPVTERLEMERILVRGGRVRHLPYSVRLYGAPEFAEMLRQAGFSSSRPLDYTGGPLSRQSPALLMLARK